MNYENIADMGSQPFESFDNFIERLETHPEAVSDSEILSRFDENQLEYINSLQENPTWGEMTMEQRYEHVKNSVGKFLHNTELGRYWGDHWKPFVACLVKSMPRI